MCARTAYDKQPAARELSSDSDDDDVAANTVVAASSPASAAEQIRDAVQVPRRHSADDRPITPMRNQMLYSMMLESYEFADGALLSLCPSVALGFVCLKCQLELENVQWISKYHCKSAIRWSRPLVSMFE